MKRFILGLALLSCLAIAADKPQGLILRPEGATLNPPPIIQRTSADQTALTDSTGGSVADTTLAATAKTAELANELRAALVALGAIAGS